MTPGARPNLFCEKIRYKLGNRFWINFWIFRVPDSNIDSKSCFKYFIVPDSFQRWRILLFIIFWIILINLPLRQIRTQMQNLTSNRKPDQIWSLIWNMYCRQIQKKIQNLLPLIFKNKFRICAGNRWSAPPVSSMWICTGKSGGLARPSRRLSLVIAILISIGAPN